MVEMQWKKTAFPCVSLLTFRNKYINPMSRYGPDNHYLASLDFTLFGRHTAQSSFVTAIGLSVEIRRHLCQGPGHNGAPQAVRDNRADFRPAAEIQRTASGVWEPTPSEFRLYRQSSSATGGTSLRGTENWTSVVSTYSAGQWIGTKWKNRLPAS